MWESEAPAERGFGSRGKCISAARLILLRGMVNIPRVKLGGISPTMRDGAFLGCHPFLEISHLVAVPYKATMPT